MALDLSNFDFSGTSHKDYKVNFNKQARGNLTSETIGHVSGEINMLGQPTGPATTRGTQTTLKTPKGMKVHFTAADGTRVLAKKGCAKNGLPYEKILYKPNANAPWEVISYTGGDFSFSNVRRIKNLPNFIDITSFNAPIKADWNLMNIGVDFKGFKAGLPGLDATQLKKVQKFVKTIQKLF